MAADDLTLLYFAWVRDRVGVGQEVIAHPGPDCTVAALLDILAAGDDAHAAAFTDRARLRAALDQNYVSLESPIGAAHELAIFPPVTGGDTP
ncbi:MAG: MoaD/ThiS family protein [Sphingobium sp.]